MAFMYVWKEAGYLMVFFLSGIQSISTDVNEAARIDGANSWTIFRKITLPLLAPTFLFVSTIALTNSFKLVDHVVIMTEELQTTLPHCFCTTFTSRDLQTSTTAYLLH